MRLGGAAVLGTPPDGGRRGAQSCLMQLLLWHAAALLPLVSAPQTRVTDTTVPARGPPSPTPYPLRLSLLTASGRRIRLLYLASVGPRRDPLS